MNRKYSLKANHEIEKLVHRKRSVGNGYYAIYFATLKTAETHIAISVSKKLGNAVARNYQKRVIREILRPNLHKFSGLDLLIVQKRQALNLSFSEKESQILGLLEKINKNEEKK